MSSDHPTFAEIGEQNIRHRSVREQMFRKLAEIQEGQHTVRIVED
jgi:hypothetical protein